jgi:hypothetical protein
MKKKIYVLTSVLSLCALSQASFAAPGDDSKNNDPACTTTTTTITPIAPVTITARDLFSSQVVPTNSVLGTDSPDDITATDGYHRGGGGGSGDGITGKNIIYAGVGFVGGLQLIGSLYTAEGYSASSTPTITVAYERGLSQHWGVGFIFDYSSVTLNSTGTVDNSGPYYPNAPYAVYSYTNSDKLTGIAFGATGAYHFTASEKVDPYIGIALGYTSVGFSYTTNDPNAQYDGNTEISISGTGVMFGGFLGIRIYFTDHIGAWADIGYLGYGGSLLNLGLAAKF